MFGDQPLTFTLVAAVATPRYTIVVGSGANYGGPATSGSGTNLVGINQYGGEVAGEMMTVGVMGKSRCIVGSAVTAYAKITSTASGHARPVSVVSGAGETTIGFALEAGSPGDLIPVMLTGPASIGAV